jgi:hypothetical protein
MDKNHQEILLKLGAVRVDGLEIRMNATVQRVIKSPDAIINVASCGIYNAFDGQYAIYVSPKSLGKKSQVWVINLRAKSHLAPWVEFIWADHKELPIENELTEFQMRLLVPNKPGEEIDSFGLIGRASYPDWSPKEFVPTN